MHALVINFNATFLFHSLLLVVNSSMKYQIYTKCIVLWDPELKFSSSWSFFNTCVKYMYWYDKTRSIIQRTSLNAIGTSLTSFNAIGTSLELFRQAEKPLGPLRQVEKKTFSTWKKRPSDVPIAFNGVIKNKCTFTKYQASMLKF